MNEKLGCVVMALGQFIALAIAIWWAHKMWVAGSNWYIVHFGIAFIIGEIIAIKISKGIATQLRRGADKDVREEWDEDWEKDWDKESDNDAKK